MANLPHWVVLLALAFTPVLAEIYTALVDMEELLEPEAALLRTLEDYISAQERKLQLIKKKYVDFTHEHEEASRDVNHYLSNPLNGFLLVKRLTSDWKDIEAVIKTNIGISQDKPEAIKNITMLRDTLKFPTDEDLTGAAVALMRLQDTYQLETSSMAQGEINGVQYSTQLSVADCFELGRQSYNYHDFYHTVLWMTEALSRHEQEINKTMIERWEILEYLAYSTYMQGNVKSALQMTDELLRIMPGHKETLVKRQFYLAALEKDAVPLNFDQKKTEDDNRPVSEIRGQSMYELLCRDAVRPPVSLTSQLKCRYVHYNRPFLRIAPLKEEEAYLSPRIVLFRESLYDSEIKTFRKIAQPRLTQATEQNSETGDLEVAQYRICKFAWLEELEHAAVARVSRRIEAMTGLSTSTAEELHVINYGLGGHYEPHYDFAREREENKAFQFLGIGNRIATVLFYMNDVEQGGATVFPELKLSLWPEKGTAAFWMNLHPSGEGDLRTLHAACPVLAGTKWVSNKWLHERGQEFRRPCKLTKDVDDQDRRQ